MKISEVISLIEEIAPLPLQEEYDNAGMQVGDKSCEATGALLCIDVTEDIIDEAIQQGLNLVISHHPLLFKGLKSITGRDYIERIVIMSIIGNNFLIILFIYFFSLLLNYRNITVKGLGYLSHNLNGVAYLVRSVLVEGSYTYARSVL